MIDIRSDREAKNVPELSIEDKHATLEYLALNAESIGLFPEDVFYAGLDSEKYSEDFQDLLNSMEIVNGEYFIKDSPEDFIVRIFKEFGDDKAYDFFEEIGVLSYGGY